MSFQQGLWELLATQAALASRCGPRHDLPPAPMDRGERSVALGFLYMRGHLDWDSAAGAQLVELNRNLAQAYRDWMAPLLDSRAIRSMSMLMLTAIVTGPAHAIVQRWLAGHLVSPLHAYLDELADAA